jgi:hypothetical protein
VGADISACSAWDQRCDFENGFAVFCDQGNQVEVGDSVQRFIPFQTSSVESYSRSNWGSFYTQICGRCFSKWLAKSDRPYSANQHLFRHFSANQLPT